MVGTSGGYVTDLNPERAYDVDMRRLDDEEKRTAYAGDIRNEKQQNRVEKFLRAKKSAGKFRQKMNYDQPFTDRQGQTPAFIEGDPFGKAGATNYANKPQSSTNRLYTPYTGFA
jgi:hypothetical protein